MTTNKILNYIKAQKYLMIVLLVILFFSYKIVSAGTYGILSISVASDNLPMEYGDSMGPNGCPIRRGDTIETCDIEPGGYQATVNANLTWNSGFTPPLPSMGIGAPTLGYIPASYPMTCAAASSYSGSGPGNSNGSTICEIAFNSSTAGNGTANYFVYMNSDAVRGNRYLLDVTSNGGTNSVFARFYARVKPLASCTISSFTCDANTNLTWTTSNCNTANIDNGIGSVAVGGPITRYHNSFGTTYRMTAVGTRDSATPAFATCGPAPTLNATFNENGGTTLRKTASPTGQSFSIPFTFRKSGSASLKFVQCKVSDLSNNTSPNVRCLTPVGSEISN